MAFVFDPLEPDFIQNPWPYYERARGEAPVMRHDEQPFQHTSLFLYDDIKAVFADWETFSSDLGEEYKDLDGGEANGFIFTDPPHHTKMRRMIQQPFMPRFVKSHRPRIERLTKEVFDKAFSKGVEFNYISEIADHIPVAVLAEILGIPANQRMRFKHAGDRIVKTMAVGPLGRFSEEMRADRLAAFLEMHAVSDPILDMRKDDPKDDLMTVIAQAEKSEIITRADADGLVMLALIAGHGTTRRMMGNTLKCLLENPEQEAMLREDMSLIPNAINEVLRLNGSLRYTTRRCTKDVVIRGVSIFKDEYVNVWMASGNRDESVFANPNKFDPTRSDLEKSMTFGGGGHLCLGRELARLEGAVVLTELLNRTESFDLSCDFEQLQVADHPVTWGLTELPIKFRLK